MTARAEPVRLLHVAGLHGTGSTILANILGEIDGWFAVGELAYLWQAVQRRDPCGCGKSILECDVWARTLGSLFSDPAEAVERLRPDPAWVDLARLPSLLAQERRHDEHLARYRTTLGDLLRALRDTTGARVLVETSKHPPFGRILARTPVLEASVLHLVRDPRASAYAWLRVTPSRLRTLVAGAMWTTWHGAIPPLWASHPYLAVRYEDFVAAPRQAIHRIAAFAGEPDPVLPFVDEHTVRLRPNHMPAGNRNRLRAGLIDVSAHDEWRSSLSRGRAAATVLVAAPLLGRWGYRARG